MAAIGIDLGTSNSCVAYCKDGRTDIVYDASRSRTTPSAVAFCDGEIEVGKFAFDKFVKYPDNVIFGIKYLIGRKFTEKTVQEKISTLPFTIVNDNNKINIMVQVNKQKILYTPEQISGILLKQLKINAEKQLKTQFDNVVITVPTYFNDAQRHATIDAGKIAGFINVQLLNEAAAAAIAYGIENSIDNGLTLLVFDLGGGTFDVSVLRYNQEYKVLNIDGNLHTGGDDIDNNLLKLVCNTLKEKHGIIAKDKRTLYRLKKICESAKLFLSTQSSTEIELFTVFRDAETITLTRDEFNKMNSNLFLKCTQTIENCIQAIHMNPNEIDAILLVGGSTRIPKIEEIIEEYFGKHPKRNINPDEAVAIGAAIYSARLQKLAYPNLNLKSISARSLGVELIDKSFSVLIPKCTEIPTEESEEFITVPGVNNRAIIKIYTGENDLASENELLGVLKVAVTKNNEKSTNIVVTFKISEDGILYVSVVDENGNLENLDIQLDQATLSNSQVEEFSRKVQEDFDYSDKIKFEKYKN